MVAHYKYVAAVLTVPPPALHIHGSSTSYRLQVAAFRELPTLHDTRTRTTGNVLRYILDVFIIEAIGHLVHELRR